ncbi:MAG: hypothetical protein CME04_03155 [Gemmatimonadaceae bacterium]|nr:hypothetical protein [Gemmatimonadaceae bacterium]
MSPLRGLRRVLGRLATRRRPLAPVSRTSRGAPRLIRREDGESRCVACVLCAGACPSRCIVVEAGPPPGGDGIDQRARVPRRFELDLGRCLLCGLCEAACPEAAISLSGPTLLPSAPNAEDMQLDLDALLATA